MARSKALTFGRDRKSNNLQTDNFSVSAEGQRFTSSHGDCRGEAVQRGNEEINRTNGDRGQLTNKAAFENTTFSAITIVNRVSCELKSSINYIFYCRNGQATCVSTRSTVGSLLNFKDSCCHFHFYSSALLSSGVA